MPRTRASLRLALLLALSLPAWTQEPATPANVVVEERVLFTIQTNLGPFTAQDRATAAGERLSRVVKDLTASVEALSAVPGDTSTDIVLRDRILLTVTDDDAQAANLPRAELVAQHVQSIRSAVQDLRADYSDRSLLEGATFTVGLTALLILLLIAIRRLWSAAIRKLRTVRIPPLRIQNVELISTAQLLTTLVQAAKAIRFLVVAIALYIYVPLVLSLFPWTRKYAPTLMEYITSPLSSAVLAILDYLPSLVVLIICIAGANLLIRMAGVLFRELATGTIEWPGFFREWADPTYKIVRFLILAMTVVVAFPYLPGSHSPAFQGVSIFIGVLFSLGSTSAVSNIVGGVILTYSRAFQVGDRVKIADTVGDVLEKSLLATRVRTIKNEVITVPNSMVLSSHIVNFSQSEAGAPLILHTSVTIGYDAPWRTVHSLLIEAALRTTRIVSDPHPFVLQTSLDDFYVTYQINAYTSEPSKMALTYAELHQNIQDRFNEAGVEIMSSHYAALRDGNATTRPAGYLPKDYAAPGFRIEHSSAAPNQEDPHQQSNPPASPTTPGSPKTAGK